MPTREPTIDLSGKICLVTGASRGIGKGIAVQLAYHGATCYVTGRHMESLQVLDQQVEIAGGSGKCIPIQCDHENDEEISKLFERLTTENDGKLDLLVNNAYSAIEHLTSHWGVNFWEQIPEAWDITNNVGLRNHYICSYYAAKMMVENRKGLILYLSSIGGLRHLFSVPYGVGKAATDRLARDIALELEIYNVAAISLWPGLTRTETVVKKARENPFLSQMKENLENAETPIFIGRAVAALLSEPHEEVMTKSGKVLQTTEIARAHGITDEFGQVPISMFQLNVLLKSAGFRTLAKYVPDFLRIPLFVMQMMEAYRNF